MPMIQTGTKWVVRDENGDVIVESSKPLPNGVEVPIITKVSARQLRKEKGGRKARKYGRNEVLRK